MWKGKIIGSPVTVDEEEDDIEEEKETWEEEEKEQDEELLPQRLIEFVLVTRRPIKN